MKFPARLIMLLSTLFFFTNISFAHADDVTDQVTAYRTAKSVFEPIPRRQVRRFEKST